MAQKGKINKINSVTARALHCTKRMYCKQCQKPTVQYSSSMDVNE